MVACSGGADSTRPAGRDRLRGPQGRLARRRRDRRPRPPGRARPSGPRASSRRWPRSAPTRRSSARVHVEAAGLGPEAAARQARYAVLEEVAERFDAAAVLLGHTRDDQAETVLLGLARGSGGRSLAGMRRALRPRSSARCSTSSRADTVTACQVEGIEIWDDPHNQRPGLHPGPGAAHRAARARGAARPRGRRDPGPHRRPAPRRHGPARRPRRGGVRRAPGADGALPVGRARGQPAPVRRRVLRLAALAAGAPASELFHEHVLGDGRAAHRLARPALGRPARARCAVRPGARAG